METYYRLPSEPERTIIFGQMAIGLAIRIEISYCRLQLINNYSYYRNQFIIPSPHRYYFRY